MTSFERQMRHDTHSSVCIAGGAEGEITVKNLLTLLFDFFCYKTSKQEISPFKREAEIQKKKLMKVYSYDHSRFDFILKMPIPVLRDKW